MDREERNLDVVGRHMAGEAHDPASILELYTDDIVFEVPGREIRLTDKAEIEETYRAMFASIEDLSLRPVSREAAGDTVEDVTVAEFRLSGDGFARAPVPVGGRVELRLHHVFEMRDGLIARETVHETWRALDD